MLQPLVERSELAQHAENADIQLLISPTSVGMNPFTPRRLCRTPAK
jgi:hypothetical protein